MSFFLYRFMKDDEVIYVGKTIDINRRIREHFLGNGHLEHECYYETDRVEFSKVNNRMEMDILELYFINKFSPKYNNKNNYNDSNLSPYLNINESDITWNSINEFDIYKAKFEMIRSDIDSINTLKLEINALKEKSDSLKNDIDKVYSKIEKISKIRRGLDEVEDETPFGQMVTILIRIKNMMMGVYRDFSIQDGIHYKVYNNRFYIDFKTIWPILEELYKYEGEVLMERREFNKLLAKSKYICGRTSKEYYKKAPLRGKQVKTYCCNLDNLTMDNCSI
ncbi:MAG: GIY-YIG nuclease family protein [Romboutsia sp.]|nr:GIY-YIG nuclease family protein [Romboutsia sp.]